SAPPQWAPDLSGQGSRVHGDWLREYLGAPQPIRPAGPQPGLGGQMPDFDLSPAEGEAIASFLENQVVDDLPAWEPDALTPFSMQKAETLLRDRWSCLGCHQLGDDGGRVAPRLDGIAARLRPEFLRRLIEAPGHVSPGTVMPASLEQPDRLDLMASFLLQRRGDWTGAEHLASLPEATLGGGSVMDRRLAPGEPKTGEALYQSQCAVCHGVEGQGDGFNASFLPTAPTVHAAADSMSLRPDDTLYDGIHAGGWILGKSHRMPAFGASLSSDQIRSLVTYIRELCQCQGPAWSRDGRRGQ
ncbi:MAG: c-type cytochrome, partial [Longimicrobiales bacterium]